MPKGKSPAKAKPGEKSGWCVPLVIYIILAIIGIVVSIIAAYKSKRSNTEKVSGIVMSVLWTVLWIFLMFQLCKRGHEGWAWVILLLPIIFWVIIFVLVFVFGIIKVKDSKLMPLQDDELLPLRY